MVLSNYDDIEFGFEKGVCFVCVLGYVCWCCVGVGVNWYCEWDVCLGLVGKGCFWGELV